MKRILFCVVFLVLTTTATHAQIKYGFKAGVNFADAKINSGSSTIDLENRTSFHVNGFIDISVNNYLSFQPGISWQGKGYRIDYVD